MSGQGYLLLSSALSNGLGGRRHLGAKEVGVLLTRKNDDPEFKAIPLWIKI